MSDASEFEDVRRDPDPIRRGRRATALLTRYQQRAAELARLRRAAIEEAHDQGLSYTEIATALGVSKGRITQIKTGAPPAERAFFGIGPVAVGVPLREGADHRTRTYVDAADAATQEQIESILASLALASSRFPIPASTADPPAGDTVVICGPLSAPVGAKLLAADPALAMVKEDDRWWINDRRNGQRHGSPADDEPAEAADIAYLARHRHGDRVIVHIAGIHSLGSQGVAHYLARHVGELWRTVGDETFSMAIRCLLDGLNVTDSAALTEPYIW